MPSDANFFKNSKEKGNRFYGTLEICFCFEMEFEKRLIEESMRLLDSLIFQ